MKKYNKLYLSKFSLIFIFSIAIVLSTNCAASSSLKDIVILYTNDVHGHFCETGKLDYSNLKCIKEDLINEGKDVLLLDAGDHLSGCLNGAFDHGETILETMNDVGYDAATLGNHEFDFGMDYLKEYTKEQDFPYLCTNLYNVEDGEITTRVVDPYKIFELHGQKIGVIGISTPDTIGVCAPKSFQNDQGEYIYSFLGGDDGSALYSNIQAQVDHLKNDEQCKYVIALSHLGYDDGQTDYKYSSPSVIRNTNGIDILIDGHSHDYRMNDKFANKDGKKVYCTQAGSFFDYVGKIYINTNGQISITSIDSYSKYDSSIKNNLNDYLSKIDQQYGQTIACSHKICFEKDKKEGCNLFDLGADAFYYGALKAKELHLESFTENLPIIAFPNSGGFRVDYVGDKINYKYWSYKTCLQIFPFYNQFVIRKMKGDVIIRALEFSVYNIESDGSIFFPAGLTCTVNTSITTSFVLDGKNYVSGPIGDARRISNIKIYDYDNNNWVNINENSDYYVAGADYLLLNGGDGTTMFTESSVTTAYMGSADDEYEDYYDYQVMANYLKTFSKPIQSNFPQIENKYSYFKLKEKTNYTINYDSEVGAKRFNIVSQ